MIKSCLKQFKISGNALDMQAMNVKNDKEVVLTSSSKNGTH